MANKLTPEQLQMLLANMPSLKEGKTQIAEDNTGKKKLKSIPLKNKKLEEAISAYIQNKQDKYTGPSINRYNEGAHNEYVNKQRAIQEYNENSDLAKTMGSLTPSGDSKLGAIGAETVANMMPMGSGQLLASKRLSSIFTNPNDNYYVGKDKGAVENTLGAINLLGDLGMIGSTLKASGVIPKSSTILSKYAKILNEKANNKFTPYETVSEEVNNLAPKEIAAQNKALAEAPKALASGEKIIETPKVNPKAIETIKNFNVDKPNNVKGSYVIEDLPGLHLKSTMEGGAISKLIEPKTGLINTEHALAIINKESDGAKKLELVKEALGNNIPKKMDYNEFRKAIQNRLSPLNQTLATDRSWYGINNLGFKGTKNNKFPELLENKTILLSNSDKFGTGSSAHNTPANTLGHIHYYVEKENPNTINATQFQSDAFQGTHRTMPDSKRQNELLYELKKKELEDNLNNLEKNKTDTNPDGTKITDEFGNPRYVIMHSKNDGKPYQLDYNLAKEFLKEAKQKLNLKKAEINNFTEKELLDKNHLERYIQEFVKFASNKKGIDKIRIPTKETSAKVQNYTSFYSEDIQNKLYDILWEKENLLDKGFKKNSPEYKHFEELENKIKSENKRTFKDKDVTILKKYDEIAKVVKKLYNAELKIVTDSKGNTWYEFEIPKKFKEGKGEIKAFSTAAGTLLLNKLMQKNKNK